MLKFFKKYDLQWKIFATIVWSFIAIEKIFIRDEPEKRNWNIFMAVVSSLLAIINLFDVIEIIK